MDGTHELGDLSRAVQSGRNIEGDDRRTVSVDRLDSLGKTTFHLALEATAEQTVDKQFGLGVELSFPRHDHAARHPPEHS